MSKENKERREDEGVKKETSKDTASKDYKKLSGGKHSKGGKGNRQDGIPWKNDWRFYALSEQIAKDLASVPFNRIPGVPIELSFKSAAGATYAGKAVVPAIMIINYANSIGISSSSGLRTSGLNLAATQLYTFVRHANSGARNYDAADIAMYILAMRDVYSEYLEARRAIGVINAYTFTNRNMPDLLVRAIGIDPVDLRANIAQYRGRLNILAKKINSFAVPKYFKMFDRAAYISSLLFADSSSLRGQFFGFKKVGYYTWNTTKYETGTALEFHKTYIDDDGIITMEQKLNNLDSMLESLFLDTDAITMSGDILKAFNESDLYSVTETPDNYIVVPTFDEDILAQIENSVTLTTYGTDFHRAMATVGDSWDVKQENQLITFNPVIFSKESLNLGDNRLPNDLFFNSHKDHPEYTDVLEWTRLMATCDVELPSGSQTGWKIKITSSGLEIPISHTIFEYGFNSGSVTKYSVNQYILPKSSMNAQDQYNLVTKLFRVMIFDWHPAIYFANNAVNSQAQNVGMDLKVYTTIEKVTLQTMNDSAVAAAMYADALYNKGSSGKTN